MREIRLYGSEGGVAFGPSLPLSRSVCRHMPWRGVHANRFRGLRGFATANFRQPSGLQGVAADW